MFWRKKSNLDADDETWLLACWAWLDDYCGPVTRPGHPGLVLPDTNTFPRTQARGLERAQHDLKIVQRLYGMAEWPVSLVEQAAQRKDTQSIVLAGTSSRGALGTYTRLGNTAQITYDPALLDDPMKLVATLAHELAHFK